MSKGKADPNIDFYILHIGLCDAVICTSLPIEEATEKFNTQSPTGLSSRWSFDGKEKNKVSCPDGQGKTHYHLFC